VRGTVIMGVRNVFTVELDEGGRVMASIKGKILPGLEGQYNCLAPGDVVGLEPDPHDAARGRITSFEPRASSFARFNEKGMAPQTLAANVDRVLLVTSPDEPPFRPRFIDRVMVSCASQGLPLLIVLNKDDLGLSDSVLDRLRLYKDLGTGVLRVSAKTGKGMRDFKKALATGESVLTGQSGVGKSSLLNAIDPALMLRAGELCAKYGRGAHTTILSILLRLDGYEGRVVDTPGFRRFALRGIEPGNLAALMPDIKAASTSCDFGPSCAHDAESGCAVRDAAERGAIHHDRYESYLRMREELSLAAALSRSRPAKQTSARRGKARRERLSAEDDE
jgi:ribosome biogenesis GTPase / thiamine phosphate phosphatase